MKRETNQKDLEMLEQRLAAIVPVEDEKLAANILIAIQQNTQDAASTAIDSALASGQNSGNVGLPMQHTSCLASTLPLLTGLCGGMIGAALMFLVITAFASPKVEIREVVRYVPVEVSPQKVVEEQTALAPLPVPEEKPEPSPPQAKPPVPQVPRELPWFLAMLRPLTALESNISMVAMNNPSDLDAMIERRAELARQAQRYEPPPLLIRHTISNDRPSEFSPLMYKEMIEEVGSVEFGVRSFGI